MIIDCAGKNLKVNYIGKTLLLESGGERVLAIGDLHLGYGESLGLGGMVLPSGGLGDILSGLEKVFDKVGQVDKIILLGDLKHEFGKILKEERVGVLKVIGFLEEKCEKLVIIKGNHDVLMKFIFDRPVVDYFLWKGIMFLHGDKDFPEIWGRDVKMWVVGHGHPGVRISDGVKEEKYKCFLVGKFKGRKVVVVPSFFDVNEGSDPRDFDLGLAWDFNFLDFDVWVVGELDVLGFGKLKGIS